GGRHVSPSRLLARAAKHLEVVYRDRVLSAAEEELRERLGPAQRILEGAATLRAAGSGGLPATPASLRRRLRQLLNSFRAALPAIGQDIEQCLPELPSLGGLVEELRQLEAEFGGLSVGLREKTVSVVTEPITLRDVELGPFRIQLCWKRLGH